MKRLKKEIRHILGPRMFAAIDAFRHYKESVKIDSHNNANDSIYPDELIEDYTMISNLDGFLSIEGFYLFHILSKIKPLSDDPMLELGVFCGRSLLGLGCAFNNIPIVGVDPFYENFINSPAFPDEAAYLESSSKNLTSAERINRVHEVISLIDNMKKTNLRKLIRLEKTSQEEFFSTKEPGVKFQLIHIDAEHTYDAVVNIINVFDELLTGSSWIIVDDILNPGFPGIPEAVYHHPRFKKDFFPVFYGFNKGVFLYKPASADFVDTITSKLSKFYNDSFYYIRKLHDNSIQVSEK